MGIERFLIASSVTAVVSQRLVRRTCTQCRTKYEPPVEERAFLESVRKEEKDTFWHGAGCNFCAGTGYLDRIGVYELLAVTDELKRLIVRGAGHEEIRTLAIDQGMRTMRQEAVQLVADDVTTISEAVRTIYTT